MYKEIFKVKNTAFVLLVVFCIQFTELKLNVIKLSELILLALTPFIYYKRINKWMFLFILLFFIHLVITLLINPYRDFFLVDGVSFFIKPNLISIGRFLELISCVNLAALIHKFFLKKTNSEIKFYIKQIYNLNFLILMVFLALYIFYFSGIIDETRVVYELWGGVYRLRGWYSEGGPYGLMLAFTFCLSYFYKSKFHKFSRIIILFTIIFFAKSKAGILLIFTWFLLLYGKKIYQKIKQLSVFFIAGGVITFLAIFLSLAEVYIDDIKNIKREISERPTDINLVMGRISGLHIVPKMIEKNPLFGTGLGNYPITRNNPQYRTFFPEHPSGKIDAHGYGGIIQLLVDGGALIFVLFSLIIYKLYLKTNQKKFILIFICFFIFGVQIYFQYNWILLGIVIAMENKKQAYYFKKEKRAHYIN